MKKHHTGSNLPLHIPQSVPQLGAGMAGPTAMSEHPHLPQAQQQTTRAHSLSLFPFCFLELYSIWDKILAVSSQNYIADKE